MFYSRVLFTSYSGGKEEKFGLVSGFQRRRKEIHSQFHTLTRFDETSSVKREFKPGPVEPPFTSLIFLRNWTFPY